MTERMTDEEIREIEARCDAATKGPVQWFGCQKTYQLYLATVDRGRIFVMDFVRWGMRSASPRFQVRTEHGSGIMVDAHELECSTKPDHNGDFMLDHPDAVFMAQAYVDIPRLISEVLALKAEVERLLKERAELHKAWKEAVVNTTFTKGGGA